jgi:DNA-binding MarR family transcriptional regulator
LRGLEAKGLVRREVDARDARSVRLDPTARAHEDLQHLPGTWSQTLEGIVDNPETIDFLNATLRRIENELIARHRRVPHRASNSPPNASVSR